MPIDEETLVLGHALLQPNMQVLGSQPNYTLMTIKEVADFLQISRSSAYRLIEKRAIRFFKIRSGIRFNRSDVVGYLESCAVEPIGKEYGDTKN
ncbi:helix-turn-helix domain-containing protein [Candidatus Uhrbacteria bacterium]|nr:helix-turn-helix domain-containing protein [Candidatus Uhrbacteria bacterium]